MVALLAELGASLSTPNAHGETPAYMAATSGHDDVLETLSAAGYDLSLEPQTGPNSRTFACAAAQGGCVGGIRRLADAMAQPGDLHSPDSTGMTPLHYAAEQWRPREPHANTVRVLVGLGAGGFVMAHSLLRVRWLALI